MGALNTRTTNPREHKVALLPSNLDQYPMHIQYHILTGPSLWGSWPVNPPKALPVRVHGTAAPQGVVRNRAEK